MYETGRGVAQDYAEALKWYRLAAEQGVAIAQFNLVAARRPPGEDRDMAVESRDKAAKLMTPDQIAEAQRLAREWKPK